MNTYNTYTPEGQNIQMLNVEISSLEKKIKNRSILLFILAALAMIGTIVPNKPVMTDLLFEVI